MQAKAHYSFVWARGIFDRLAEKHARATKLVLALYGLTPTTMTAFLAFADPLWEFLKKRIKYWDNDLLYRNLKYLTSVTLFYVEKSAAALSPEEKRLVDRLTEVEKLDKLEEQVLKGVREEIAVAQAKALSDLTNLSSAPQLEFDFKERV